MCVHNDPSSPILGALELGLNILLLCHCSMLQVYKLLRTQGHEVVAVFTIPDAYDVGGRPDPLAEVAEEDGVPVLKFKQWRKKGEIIPEVRRESEG